mmetsp:Transcript_15729/g.22378  ORF Transcript_15729/g.22378 Transcript_15729/m.22378 type:complete len:112 (-) Transcript_15729:210-545(-)
MPPPTMAPRHQSTPKHNSASTASTTKKSTSFPSKTTSTAPKLTTSSPKTGTKTNLPNPPPLLQTPVQPLPPSPFIAKIDADLQSTNERISTSLLHLNNRITTMETNINKKI